VTSLELDASELGDLEARVERALTRGDRSELSVLGYGEVSTVLGYDRGEERLAVKRLPLFWRASEWERYHAAFHDYLALLPRRGVRPLPSKLAVVERDDGALAVWCVQPRLEAHCLLSKHLHDVSEARAVEVFERVLSAIATAVGPEVGLDGQLSNWVLVGAELAYLDVTTPLLRDDRHAERLPIGVFLASLPWALRPVVRRFMLQGILDKYYEPRGVVLDLLGNLHKEKLERWLPRFLEIANARVSPRLSQDEVRRYYDSDARSWALLQRLRHMDRWWQTRVRRKVYPFLLPGSIER